MKKIKVFSIVLMVLSVFCLCFSSCEKKEKGLLGTSKTYKVDVKFEGTLNGYFKQVNLGGINDKGLSANLVNAETKKEISTTHLNDANYTFATSNSFTFTEKLTHLIVIISATSDIDNTENLKVSLTVYEDGKVIKTITETATSEKDVDISQTFSGN